MGSLIINGKQFSGVFTATLAAKIIQEIKKLPEPRITPMHATPIENEEIGLCLQREAIYLDEFYPANTIQYLGSKNAYDCIVVYIRSETDHLIIHCDGSPVDFTQWLNKFNSNKNIFVSLAGGLPSKDKEKSESKLRHIVSDLYNAAKELNIDFTLLSQKIIENNAFTHEDRYEFIFDKIMEKANIICRQYFKKSLDEKAFSARKITDFIDRSFPVSDEMKVAMGILFSAAEIYEIANSSKLDQLDKEFRKTIKTEKHFIQLVDCLFSREGFLLHDNILKKLGYRFNKLANFVFNIKSGDIFVISSQTKTPHEYLRAVFVADIYQDKKYFLCYDGEIGRYFKPKLTKAFLKKCHSLDKLICDDRPMINKAMVAQTYDAPYLLTQYNMLVRFIKLSLKDTLDVKSLLNEFTVFKCLRKTNNFYYEENIINQNLILLNELTGLNFTAKKRYYPEHTIDAVLSCDSENQAHDIQKSLEAKNIYSVLMKFDKTDHHCLCVQAINVGHYANSINESWLNAKIKM